jgi:uncharacterized membrane protein
MAGSSIPLRSGTSIRSVSLSPQEVAVTTPPGPGAAGPTTATGGSGLADHVAGTLCYALGPITGILFFVLDRHRPFVRFHALQAIGITIVWIALSVALTIVGMALAVIPVLGWLADFLLVMGVSLLGFALWIWLMVQAWRGNRWEFPAVGPQVNRIAAQMDNPVPPEQRA